METEVQHDLQNEIEANVLGALMSQKGPMLDDLEGISVQDFFFENHRAVFTAIQFLQNSGSRSEPLEVSAELDARAVRVPLSELAEYAANCIPSSGKRYFKLLREATMRRQLSAIGLAVNALAKSPKNGSIADSINEVQNMLMALDGSFAEREAVHVKDAAIQAMVEMERRLNAGDDSLSGLTTGISGLDRSLGGLQNNDLIVVAGRSSMGKTSLAMHMANAAALSGKKALMFSMEMSAMQMAQRQIAALANISLTRLVNPVDLDEDFYDRMNYANGRIAQMDFHVDDSSSLSVAQMRARAKRRKLKSGLDLIVVDQLSFVKFNAERKTEGYGQVTGALKGLAKELGIPVVLLHQLNRDTAKEGRRPALHDLKDSGSVEEDADVVILIHRPGYYNDQINQTETELIIAKNRMGARETVRCGWRGASASFCDQPYDDGSGKPFSSDAEYKPVARRKGLS